ncbi:MAG: lasso RiPP family leader peptide-containing protein [Sphaerochaetaceae bacterium]|nr:lasso RiPP family leader peptide-containing protein [Sphaerochaetaceae bacterium]
MEKNISSIMEEKMQKTEQKTAYQTPEITDLGKVQELTQDGISINT